MIPNAEVFIVCAAIALLAVGIVGFSVAMFVLCRAQSITLTGLASLATLVAMRRESEAVERFNAHDDPPEPEAATNALSNTSDAELAAAAAFSRNGRPKSDVTSALDRTNGGRGASDGTIHGGAEYENL